MEEKRTPVEADEAIAELEHDIEWRHTMIIWLREGMWRAERSPVRPFESVGELHFMPTPKGLEALRAEPGQDE